MGSWSETCGFSRLAITAGDKAVMIPLVGNGVSYDIIGLPIRGEYDDYGSIENITTEMTMATLQKDLITKIANEDVTVNEKDYTLDSPYKTLNAIERGYLNVPPTQFDDVRYGITQVMFHADIFDKVIEDFGNRKPYESDETLLSLITKVDKRDRLEYLEKVDPDKNPLSFLYDDGKITEYAGKVLNTYNYNAALPIRAAFEVNDPDLMLALREIRLLRWACNYGRIAIRPTGTGSQSEDFGVWNSIRESSGGVMNAAYNKFCKDEGIHPHDGLEAFNDKEYISNPYKE